jgi:hypothetical protein
MITTKFPLRYYEMQFLLNAENKEIMMVNMESGSTLYVDPIF